MSASRWVWILEADGDGAREPVGVSFEAGQSVTVGRDGQLQVGLAVPDLSISRVAVTVTAAVGRWQLDVTNRNGAVMYPWGQASQLAEGKVSVSWPLTGLRLRGEKELEHWVLLESPQVETSEDGPTGSTNSITRLNERPLALTAPQVEALTCLFSDMLSWPPVAHAQPLQLKQAATRLGITTEAVQQRLRLARAKATELGLARYADLADPEYLYVLVRAGYLHPHVLPLSARRLPGHPGAVGESGDVPAPPTAALRAVDAAVEA